MSERGWKGEWQNSGRKKELNTATIKRRIRWTVILEKALRLWHSYTHRGKLSKGLSIRVASVGPRGEEGERKILRPYAFT